MLYFFFSDDIDYNIENFIGENGKVNDKVNGKVLPSKPEKEVPFLLPPEPKNPEALKYGSPMPEIRVVTVDSTGRNNIVLVDSKAAAGLPYHINEPEYYGGLPAFTLPGFQYQQGHFIAIEITGDSMHPTILHGDYIIAKELEHVSEINSGSVYVLVTKSGVVCKRLYYTSSNSHIECVSDNEIHSPRNEPLEDVLRVYCAHSRLSSQLRNYNSDVRRYITELKSKIYNIEELLNKKL